MTILKNTLKTNWKLIVVVAIAAFALGLLLRPSSDDQTHAAGDTEAATWTCSMHPQIRQPQAGKCPICAMDLIPVVEDEGSAELSERQLKLSPAAQKLASLQTSRVERKAVSKSMSLYGKIAIDERRQKSITAWAPGRIEKLFIDFTGATVQQGDALAEIYSPELFVAQQEYLNALRHGSPLLSIEPVKKKFELWGITPQQLDDIAQRGTASERMAIMSPLSGIVLQKVVTQGQYVKTGATLYEIADLSRVWVYLDAYEQDLAWLKEGQSITFSASALPGDTFAGKIDFIDPVLDPASRTVKVRAVADNPAYRLKPGLLVSATISTSSRNALVVPASAVLLTGERAVVYIAVPDKKGIFEGREITVGERSGDYYIVKDGLFDGDIVVTNGAFKIDSEMQLLAKKSMMSPDGGHAPAHNHGQASMTETHADDSRDTAEHQTESDSMVMRHHESDPRAEGVSAHFVESLDAVYLAYFEIQDQLAHDKTDKLAAAARALRQGLNAIDAAHAGAHQSHWQQLAATIDNAAQLIATNNIGIARAEFKKMSDAMIETATTFGASNNVAVKQYHCPMAFNDEGADWLSPKNDVENPYFGDAMFSCGWRVKTFSEPGGDHE